MAHISRDAASQVEAIEGEFDGRYETLHGTTVGFETYHTESDMTPLFAGLPDDACQCVHQGYVIRGRVTFRYTDGSEETITAGQAYVIPPGHTLVIHPDTEVVEFSPAEDLAQTMEVVLGNLARLSS